MKNSSIESPLFLEQGNSPNKAAQAIVGFIQAAKKSCHIAIYDFQLDGEIKDEVVNAIKSKANEGVEVKIAFDHTKQNQIKGAKGSPGNDPAPRGTMAFVAANFPAGEKVQSKPIAGSHLMHNKYIIRDEGTEHAAVLMGSANFTMGAWHLQENNILKIHSRKLADHYETDFNDLWTTGDIKKTGANDYGLIDVNGTKVEVAFAPGDGSATASLFVDAIQGAKNDIWLSTMVLSSGSILGGLIDFLERGGTIRGVYDATQMKNIERIWGKSKSTKLSQWNKIKGHLKGKHSTPFKPDSPHDFMHNKFLVTNKTVVTGSFNLSNAAESNSENALSIHNEELAKKYRAYVERLLKLSKHWK